MSFLLKNLQLAVVKKLRFYKISIRSVNKSKNRKIRFNKLKIKKMILMQDSLLFAQKDLINTKKFVSIMKKLSNVNANRKSKQRLRMEMRMKKKLMKKKKTSQKRKKKKMMMRTPLLVSQRKNIN
jgi:hypothetical protein